MEHEEKKGGRSVSRPREEKQPLRSARNEIVVEWAGAARTTRGQSRRLCAPPPFFALATGTFASR